MDYSAPLFYETIRDIHVLALDPFKEIGDPLADDVVAVLVKHPSEKDKLAQVERLAYEGDPVCQVFIKAVTDVPTWYDPAKANAGRELLYRNPRMVFLVLMQGGFPTTYVLPGIADVLAQSGRLEKQTHRRVFETASMVRDATQYQGLSVGSGGWRAALRVRLLHAFIRRALSRSKKFFHPINQLEMAQTSLVFSHVVSSTLKQIGVSVSEEEADAYRHLWRYINHLGGLHPDLQCNSCDEEASLFDKIMNEYSAPNNNSRELAANMRKAFTLKPPFYAPEMVFEAISMLVMPKHAHSAFGLQEKAHHRVIIGIIRLGNRLRFQFPARRASLVLAGERYVDHQLINGLAGDEADFAPVILNN